MMLDLVSRLLEAPLVVSDPFAVADAIVVLGAPLARGERLGTVLAERVRVAASLYARGAAPLVVPTGGVTARARVAEAAVMADALEREGVPRGAILVEDRARSTAENAANVAALIGAGRDVWLVTQPFHGRRARWLFARAGLHARVWHVTDSVQYADRRRALRWLVREYGAWAGALLRRRRRR